LFKTIDDNVKDNPYYNSIHKSIIIDYLNHFNLKPKAWWDEIIDKKEKNSKLREFFDKNIFDLSIDDLYKHAIIIPLKDIYIVAIYKSNYKLIKEIKKDCE
ncbi:MAG: hypothetical protein J6Y42_03810, partial [Bacilli bacterium]|nr:hypothetical protein [Bacilli bacterium]